MLSSHARIAVVAPASAPNQERLAAAMKVLRSWDFVPVAGRNLNAQHGHTAGTEEQRAADLSWALTAPDIDAVWFARGGYGTIHSLKHLPWGRLDDRPVIGFSDATALLAALANRKMRAVHGPVLETLVGHSSPSSSLSGLDEESCGALHALLAHGRRARLPGRLISGKPTPVTGRVVGGNLSVLASLVGTPWALQMDGAILILEDTNEAPYRLDRLMTQLIESGSLQGVVGVAFGTFKQCTRPSGPPVETLLADMLSPLGVPVVAGLPIGHGAANVAWIHGAIGVLSPQGVDWHEPSA